MFEGHFPNLKVQRKHNSWAWPLQDARDSPDMTKPALPLSPAKWVWYLLPPTQFMDFWPKTPSNILQRYLHFCTVISRDKTGISDRSPSLFIF